MADPLNILLDHKGFGAIYFDEQLRVIETSPAAQQLQSLTLTQPPLALITDIFPELVGIEDDLQRMVAKQKSVYQLDFVNRRDKQGQTRYLNLLLLA